jgi:type IV pilus assembly protein PilF
MDDKGRGLAYFLTILMWLAGIATVGGSLSACVSSAPVATASQESFTDSDEPESRKRATNRLRLAVLYFGDGKMTIALDEVKQAIAADPNWFEAYNMRGLVYMRMGDFALSSASFQRALAINPGSAEVKHNYAVLLCKNSRTEDALKLFTSTLETPGYGRRANTLVEQGVCQMSNGMRQEAESSFMRSYELDAANPVAGYNLALLLFQRNEFLRSQFYVRRLNNTELANSESLWLGIKVERKMENREAMAQLGGQLKKRFPQSPEASAFERGAFDE